MKTVPTTEYKLKKVIVTFISFYFSQMFSLQFWVYDPFFSLYLPPQNIFFM